MKMMLRPLARSRRSTANSRSISGGDRAEVGSSRMMMRAPENSTRDSSTSCCRPIGSVPSVTPGSTSMPRLSSCSAAAFCHAAPVDDAEPVHRLHAEEHVLGDGQVRHDAEFLMHHADAGGERIARRAEADLPPVDAHAAA